MANLLANIAGALAGLMLAFSPVFWTYAIGSEVFALNNALMAALVYTLATYGVYGSIRSVYVCSRARA